MPSVAYKKDHRNRGLCTECPTPIGSLSTVYCDYHRVKKSKDSLKSWRKTNLPKRIAATKVKLAALEAMLQPSFAAPQHNPGIGG